MTGAKFDIEKFDGTGDFRLWRVKMRALLIQHGCEVALEVLPADMEAQTKVELNKKAHTLTLEDVMATLNSKEIKERSKTKGDDGEWLYVRGRTDRRNSHQLRGKSRSKSRGGRLKGSVRLDHGFKRFIPHETKIRFNFDFLECDGGKVLLGDNKECKIRGIGKERLRLKDGSSFVLHNVRDNCVYSLDGHAVAGELNASAEEKDSLTQVWHKRLGHISEAGLHVLEKQGLFGKKSLGSNRLCSFRLMRSFSGGIIRRFKHEAFEKFKKWKQLVENQIGRMVKKLRMDNGLELGNREFKQLCIESGISRHLIVVETPQQNGLAERMNRTLMDKKKTPMEMWLGHPSDYGMLKTFGCVAYSHVQQGKLEPRAVKCVILGYPKGVKGYKLYRLDNESPKIVTSRNMVFNESVMYKDTLKDSGAGADKCVEELQVEVELQRLNNHTLEEDQTNNEDQTDQDDGDDEDAGDQEIDQPLSQIITEEEDTHEPLTYQQAVACEDSSKWKAAMKEEMDSLRKNKTWELVDHQVKKSCLAHIYSGYTCIDWCKDFELEQLDVKMAFLHGNLEEVIYMRQPPRYEQGSKVCLLKKSLYGLKQSPRQWYRRFDEYMLSNGFKRSSYDICVYYRSYAPGEYIYLLLYVDEMLIACKSMDEIGSTKSLLKREFDVKDLEEAKKILGMEIVRDRSRKIRRVSQSGYISKILDYFRIDNKKSVQMPLGGHFKLSLKDCSIRDCDVERMSKVPYANAVGSLMYLMVCTRLDIVYAVSIVSRYLANPGKNHWEAVKWILKYLRGTANVGLIYGTNRGNHKNVTGMCCKLEGNATTRGGSFNYRGRVYGPYGGCEGSYLAKVTLERVREVLEAKTTEFLKVGTEHNAADALTNVVHGHKLQHCLELLSVGIG
nr:putative polyprotein [Tanacetum cinerariifolium]